MADYRVQVRLKNNNILQRIERAGFTSIAEFCRVFDLPYPLIVELVGIKTPALKSNGEYRNSVERLASALGCYPDELFTERQARAALTAKAERNISENEALSLASPEAALLVAPNQDIEKSVDLTRISRRLLLTLPDRERDILQRRFGFDGPEQTLEQIGEAYGLSRDRIRQIEGKALRRLKHPARCGFAAAYRE